MSTRSRIGIMNEDRTITSIYCHSDGYPNYNGFVLLKYYNTEEKIRELIALGDLSSLGSTTKMREMPRNISTEFISETTLDYNRWRNEGTTPVVHKTQRGFVKYQDDGEYFYLFKDGAWYYATQSAIFKKLEMKTCTTDGNKK